uniref:Uncharacterized protein n=1 Tax=viral metagenome TaxID=1070528 RepID=A0A6C0EPR5_9ZZZZ
MSRFPNINDNYDSYNNEEIIRSPDESKIERLIEDNRSNEEKELDDVLYQSLQDFHKINEDYEKRIIQDFEIQLKSKKEIFSELFSSLTRISKYDTEVKEVFDIIEPIIDSYCMSYIEFCELDKITYDKIFKTIYGIRCNKMCIEILKNIIIKSN